SVRSLIRFVVICYQIVVTSSSAYCHHNYQHSSVRAPISLPFNEKSNQATAYHS
ncbi:unnamed protein product, partial [Amoebophrya sp. A25]